MTTPFACPECGARLELHDDCETETTMWRPNPGGMPYVERGTRRCDVASCPECEFAIEVRTQ